MTSKRSLALLLVCIALCICTVAGIQTRSWPYELDYASYLQDTSFLTIPGQVYGYCDDTTVEVIQNKIKLNCKFAMQANKAIDTPVHLQVCNFSLTKDISDKDEMYMLDDIVAIAKDRAVLKMQGLKSYLIFFLNFADCKVINSYMNAGWLGLHAPTADKVDGVFKSELNPQGEFRTIFDHNGNVIEETKVWLKNETNIICIVHSPTRGRLVVDQDISHSNGPSVHVGRIYAARDDGSTEMLKEYPIEKQNHTVKYQRIIASTTYGLMSACFKLNTTLTCVQFDLLGNLQFETKVMLDKYPRHKSFSLRNLSHGGFLLFISKCERTEKKHCIFSDSSYYVTKFNAAGKSVGTLKVDNQSDIKFSDKIHVFENEHKETCLSDVYQPPRSTMLNLEIICLKDDDFSKEVMWPNH